MRILQIDDDVREQIKKAKEYAKAHSFSFANLKRIIDDPAKAAGFDPGFVTHIHDGYRVVYSLEEQTIGWCHHISISVEAKGKYPHELAVAEILKEFGMAPLNSDETVMAWTDEETQSVNILQRV